MNCLPPETIAHILSFLTDTRSKLLARGSCRALHAASPVEKILGISKETAEWLLSNTPPERWLKPAMRNPDFTVCVHERSITVYTRNGLTRTKTESHQPLSKRYAFPTIEDHRCIITVNRESATLSIMHNLDEDEDEIIVKDHGHGVCAFCELPGIMYMATRAGVIYSLDLDQSMHDVCKEFLEKHTQLQTGAAMVFDFRGIVEEYGENLEINKVSTLDGLAFTYLINYELLVHCMPGETPIVIESHSEIKDFWLITATAAVCWLEDGSIRLLSFDLRGFTATVPITWPNPETSVIHVSPDLKSIWVLDHGMRLFCIGGKKPTGAIAARPTKSADFYRCKSNRLTRKLRETKALNILLTVKLEATQEKLDAAMRI